MIGWIGFSVFALFGLLVAGIIIHHMETKEK